MRLSYMFELTTCLQSAQQPSLTAWVGGRILLIGSLDELSFPTHDPGVTLQARRAHVPLPTQVPIAARTTVVEQIAYIVPSLTPYLCC